MPERTAPRIVAALRDGPKPTPAVAAAIGVTTDRARIVLLAMLDEGAVERVGSVKSRRGSPQSVWSLPA